MILTPVGLVVQSVVAAACAWGFGAAKGAIAYLVACVGVGVLAVAFVPSVAEHAPMWIMIALTFGLPFVAAAAGFGLAAGAMLRQGQRLIALALLSPTLLYGLGTTVLEAKQKNEWARVTDFVRAHAAVRQAAGENPRIYPSMSRTAPNGLPTRYELSVSGTTHVFAIVDVARSSLGAPQFSLACISTISPGQRDPFKDACAQ